MSGLATIQFSNPIPRRRYFQQKPPNDTSRTPAPQRVHMSPRSTSLQFREARIRHGSAQSGLQIRIEEETKRFKQDMARLNEEHNQLSQDLRLLESYNESLNIRNILELERIVYLQDRITQEEDWYKLRTSNNELTTRL